MASVKNLLMVSIFWLLFLPGSSLAQSQSGHGVDVAAVPGILAVASVAYRDFDRQLKEWERKWKAGGKAESKAQQYTSDIRNYKVELFADDGKVYVTFTVRPSGGTEFFGGVSRYILDEKTATILEHTGEK
jgi:hypothetical protein